MYDYCFRCGRWARLDPFTDWCDDCYVKWVTDRTQYDNAINEAA